MRKLIITAIATIVLTAIVGASTAFAVLGQSHVMTYQRAMSLHSLSAHPVRSLPLGIAA
jgi:hypothetical protein